MKVVSNPLSDSKAIRSRWAGIEHKLFARTRAMADGPLHRGGLLPGGAIEPGIAQIASRGRAQLEQLAAKAIHYQAVIPAQIEEKSIQLETAQEDLRRREKVLEMHRAEYRRTHQGRDPAAEGVRFRNLAFWCFAAFLTACEVPLTSAAFTTVQFSDVERFLATVSASAVTVFLCHAIGESFARPARTIAQRLFGWLLVMVLIAILTGLAAIRSGAIKEHPASTTPEVRIQLPMKEVPFRA